MVVLNIGQNQRGRKPIDLVRTAGLEPALS